MALEDITARILAKAGEEADGILSEAEEKVKRQTTEATDRIQRQMDSADERAASEADALIARIIAAADLDAKKAVLSARQDIITTAIEKAIGAMGSTEEGDYLDFLVNLLRESPVEGEAEVVVSNSDRAFMKANLASIQHRLETAGKTLRLRLSEETREIGGGILLRQGKIEYNASLPAIRRAREEELRALAAQILFPEDSNA